MKTYQDGYQDAVRKACEYLNGFLDYSELIEYQVSKEKHEEVIKDFRNFMFGEDKYD